MSLGENLLGRLDAPQRRTVFVAKLLSQPRNPVSTLVSADSPRLAWMAILRSYRVPDEPSARLIACERAPGQSLAQQQGDLLSGISEKSQPGVLGEIFLSVRDTHRNIVIRPNIRPHSLYHVLTV